MTPPLRRRLGLRGRLTLLVLAALAPVVGLVVADALAHRELGRHEARAAALVLAQTARAEGERRAADARRLLDGLAGMSDAVLGPPDACEGLLAEAVAGYPHTEVLVVAPDGQVRCASRRGVRGVDLGDRAYLRQAFASGVPVDGGYVRARTDGRGRHALGRPVTGDDGRVAAVLVAGVGLGWLGELASRGLVPPDAVVAVLDARGVPLEEHPRAPVGGAPSPQAPPVQALLAAGDGTADAPGLDGVRRVYSLARLSDGADGAARLVVGLPPDQVYGAAGHHLTRNLTWLAAASLLAAGLAAWVGRAVLVRPLDALGEAARRLEAGDLSARAGLPGAAGELGDLARAFDAMAAALERRSAEGQQAEAELRASDARARAALADASAQRERYESLLAATPDPVAIYDLQGHPLYLNPAFTETFGFTLDEVRGRLIPFVPPAEREATRAAITEVLAGRPARSAETRRQTRDGRVLDVSISAACHRDPEGHASGVVTVLRDVTAQKRSETRLQQAQRLEALGQLAGGVAHDFNNLLTVINGSAELLLDDLNEGSPLRGQVAEILRAGERAGDLTRQLLAFSRQQPLATRVVDLASAVSGVAKMLRRLIGEEVDLRLALDEGAGRVRIDPGQLEQVVLNLAVNARDAMPGGGVLEVRVEPAALAEGDPSGVPAGAYAVLSVRDTGQGIERATLEHIFEPFFTTKAVGRGTGLGLATVHGVVTQSGGHIRVESEPGRGTTFRVYLPRVGAVPEVEGARAGRAAPAGGTVLVAEDEEEVRFVVTRALEREGYTVLEAASPAQALELAAAHELDLLLTDVVMPGMRGPELAARLREQEPGLRVLFMSGYTDDALGPDTLRVVGAGLLPKPFSREALVDAVVEVMAGGRVGAA